MPAPLSSTSHAPVGAWTSLTFGTPHQGLAICQESPSTSPNADLLIAVQRDGVTTALPFIRNPADYPAWQFLAADAITRTLTPCIDEFSAAGITVRLYTPQAALPNPKRSGNLQFATAPGILIDITIDNSASDSPATAFVGLRTAGPLRPVDWASKTLCGIAKSSLWLLAATPVKDEVATLHAHNLADLTPRIDPTATTGGIVIKVAPRTTKTVSVAFAAYQQGQVTQGLDARYFYATYFPRAEAVANFLLLNGQRVRESCTAFDARTATACADTSKLALFTQGVRAYNAGTQVLDSATPVGPVAHFATISPNGARNPLDRAIDNLPWELFRNPWVVRNLFDLATTTYAYHDQLRFPTDSSPDELRAGGMTFARDFGFATAYAPGATPVPAGPARPPVSAFDGARGGSTGPGWSGGTLATEVLLNSIYMLTSYALLADDTPWAKTRLPFARELLVSLENRDHWDPAQRTGILKAESASATGPEQTAFAGADAVLSNARGNLYLAVKTFCANLMLTTYFTNNNDLHSADYSYAFAQRTAAALVAAFNKETQSLPANLLTGDSQTRLLAALEPLALPTFLGLTSTLSEYFPDLYQALHTHASTCLKPAPEGCLDGTTLRLASTSSYANPAKSISILYVLERLFRLDSPLPALWENLAHSVATHNDAQLITAALFVKPPAPTA